MPAAHVSGIHIPLHTQPTHPASGLFVAQRCLVAPTLHSSRAWRSPQHCLRLRLHTPSLTARPHPHPILHVLHATPALVALMHAWLLLTVSIGHYMTAGRQVTGLCMHAHCSTTHRAPDRMTISILSGMRMRKVREFNSKEHLRRWGLQPYPHPDPAAQRFYAPISMRQAATSCL